MISEPVTVSLISAVLGPACVAVLGLWQGRVRKADKADAEAYRKEREAEEAKAREESIAIKSGVRSLLRGSIMRVHHECIRKGYATTVDKEVIQRDFDSYDALGGNGVASTLYGEVMDLPTKEG